MASKIFDDLPLPPVARLLGWKLIAVDPQAGTIDLEFLAKTEFTNPAGLVQGGLIAAMLDDTLGRAAYAMANGERMTSTNYLHVLHLRPVRPRPVTTKSTFFRTQPMTPFLSGATI